MLCVVSGIKRDVLRVMASVIARIAVHTDHRISVALLQFLYSAPGRMKKLSLDGLPYRRGFAMIVY